MNGKTKGTKPRPVHRVAARGTNVHDVRSLYGKGASYVFEGAAVVERGYPQPDYLTHPSTTAHCSWYPPLLITHKAVPGDPRERAVRQHPGRVDLPSVANGRTGLDRQGGDIRGLNSPDPMSRQTT